MEILVDLLDGGAVVAATTSMSSSRSTGEAAGPTSTGESAWGTLAAGTVEFHHDRVGNTIYINWVTQLVVPLLCSKGGGRKD